MSGSCVRSPWQLTLVPGAPLPDARAYTISHQPLGFSLSPGDPVTVSWPDRGRMVHGTVIESTDDHTIIGLPEDVTEYADDEVRLMTVARERLRDALDLRTVRSEGPTPLDVERLREASRHSAGGFISTETVRREDEGGCNACTGKTETVTLVTLRSIGFRLCDKCRETLVAQLTRKEPACPTCGEHISCPCGVGIGT